ncbi:MAG: DUF2779 domain-containing protein [Bacteroidetes bacterium]|nr:DUF2779 domain-containing protein [Bacteroidota bacterium]
MKRYLTKSRFKIALECHAKLYYTNKKEYLNTKMDDDFLKALAEGGFQVGELAKFMFCENPVSENITVTERTYEDALKVTNQMIADGKTVIAEAAIKYDNLFIRTDLLKINYNDKLIELYEVKAKSFDNNTQFTTKKGEINSKWKPYFMDVAFQKYVVQNAFPDYNVIAYLILADKSKNASIEGLNQLFKIKKIGDQTSIEIKPGLKQKDLGRMILTAKNIDNEVRMIHELPYKDETGVDWKFSDYINKLSDNYNKDIKLFTELGSKCKRCEFRASEEEKQKGFKSGFEECWKKQAKFVDSDFQRPMVFDMLIMGLKGKLDEWIKDGKYFIQNLEDYDLSSKNSKPKDKPGLTSQDRKLKQLEKVKANDISPFLDVEGLKEEFNKFVYPLHFIDFETAMTALPFSKGRHPYEGIAFQFSHHQIDKDGSIKHQGQYINTAPGYFPNFDFVRALKSQLENDNGSIFRYHNHENTFLNHIYFQLQTVSENEVSDKKVLMDFIESITHYNQDKISVRHGERDMIDLADLVFRYYYPPQAKGSYSIKKILPAVIENSDFIRNKYNKPIYGGDSQIKSKNYSQPKIWISPDWDNDPYKALEPVFDGYTEDDFSEDTETGIEEIHQGGAAATAYARLQFSHIPEFERKEIENALLHYCELDTLAMVMIWEYWQNEINKNN